VFTIYIVVENCNDPTLPRYGTDPILSDRSSDNDPTLPRYGTDPILSAMNGVVYSREIGSVPERGSVG